MSGSGTGTARARKVPGRGGAARRRGAVEQRAALRLGKILWSTPGSQREGLELLCAAAQQGEAEALHLLGLACLHGQVVARNAAAARELQRAAANCGLPEAQFELSLLLAQGLGGPIDVRGARLWEAKAAAAGHPRACLNRGARLANSKRPDWAAVARWYARAAEGGNVEAAARLREMVRLQQAGRRRAARVKRAPSEPAGGVAPGNARARLARHAVKVDVGPRREPEKRAKPPRTGGDLRFSALLPVRTAPSRSD